MKTKPHLQTALCSEQTDLPSLSSALCFELPQNSNAPEWMQLLPVGDVDGRDGRSWKNPDPQAVIERTLASGRDVVLDWEHATELKAPKGEPAPAAAWFKEYKIEDGYIWGKPNYTPNGLESVKNQEQRYISPVFRFTKDNTIWDITSVALTNSNNLYLKALNHQTKTPDEVTPMTPEQLKALLKALGLPEDANFDTAMNHVQQQNEKLQTALNNQQKTTDLNKFVPRADHDAVLLRAKNAEQNLQTIADEEKTAAITAAIDGAVAAGKIAPASKEFYTAVCQQEGGLDQFKTYLESAPVIADNAGLDGKKPPETQTAMNAEQQHLNQFFGNSAEDLKKYGEQ